MKVTQYQANVILVANNHNPSIVTKDWLLRNEIITETLVDFTHSPLFSSVKSESYSLFVDQQRLQLELNIINENTLSQLPYMINKYVKILSEIPYQAIGFNSNWRISDIDTPNILRTIFCGKGDLLSSVFGKNHKIGGIVWFDYDMFQAQFTASHILDNDMLENTIDVNFNYQSQLKGVDDLYNSLARFELITEHASDIAHNLLE